MSTILSFLKYARYDILLVKIFGGNDYDISGHHQKHKCHKKGRQPHLLAKKSKITQHAEREIKIILEIKRD